MNYITGKDLDTYVQAVKPKPTKKKPMSFERLNMVVMTIMKYFEQELEVSKNQNDHKAENIIECLDNWVKTIRNHQNLNVNSKFESLLNIYLILSTTTNLKSVIFVAMVNFLNEHNQLEAVMIKQVQDIVKLSEDWKLSKE